MKNISMVAVFFSLVAMGHGEELWPLETDDEQMGPVYRCEGEQVELPWEDVNIDTTDIYWLSKKPDSIIMEFFAEWTPSEGFKAHDPRVSPLKSAGLVIKDLTVNDTGQVVVEIFYNDTYDQRMERRYVELIVRAPPKLSGDQLIMTFQNTYFYPFTGEFSAVIKCGMFLDKGSPKVYPRLQVGARGLVVDLHIDDGLSYLYRVPEGNPALGKYTCELPAIRACNIPRKVATLIITK